MKPLTGVRVVEFGQFIAAPATTQLLADMGAEVIKVEPHIGDSARKLGVHGEAMINAFNRGKRSIAVDLKDPAGKEIAEELIARAAIVVQNLRPGAMEGLGLGGEAVLARHPHIVYASISGFGSTGAGAGRPGLDIAAQAESGLMHVTGEAGREPQKVGAQIIDAATAMATATAVLGAYVQALRTGVGDIVETSLLGVAVHLQAPMYGAYLATGQAPERMGNGQPTVAPAADVVTTADGAFVLSAPSQAHFAKVCTLIGRPELAADPRFATNADRVANRPAMLAELRAAFATMTTGEAMDLLTANGVVAGRINTYADVAADPTAAELGIFIDTEGPTGPARTVASPWRFSAAEAVDTAGAPVLGGDGAGILTELGYTPEHVRTLLGEVVAGARTASAV